MLVVCENKLTNFSMPLSIKDFDAFLDAAGENLIILRDTVGEKSVQTVASQVYFNNLDTSACFLSV